MSYPVKVKYLLTFIVCLTLLSFCINTSAFIVNTFLQYFLFTFIAIFICVAGLIAGIKSPFKFSVIEILFFLWAIYIVGHTLFIQNGEYYQLSYLLSGICLCVMLSCLFRSGDVDYMSLYRLFAYVGFVQSVICILQYTQVISSSSKFYPVMGTFNNPNITAMFIVASIPYFLQNIHLRKNIKVHAILLVFMLLALVLLKCRTAYVGLAVIMIVFFSANKEIRKWYKSLRLRRKLSLAIVLIVLFVLNVGGFYYFKKDSADGRFFVWKITTRMIEDKPLTGYGYGLFEKEYNLYQAKYFNQNTTFTQEHKNARYVYMPYSDLFEQAVQGGIFGFLFYLMLHIVIIIKAFKSKDVLLTSIILSILVMGSINFSQQAIPLWLLLLISVAYLSSKETVFLIENKAIRYTIAMIIIIIAVPFTIIQSQKIKAHISFFAIKKEKNIDSQLKHFHHLADDIGYYEPFHSAYANTLWKSGDKVGAIRELVKASEISSSPDLFTQLALYYFQQGETEKATKLLLTVKNMVPAYFNPRLMLMDIYSAAGQYDKERNIALDVMQLPFSNDNKDAIKCRKQAQTILNRKPF